MKKFTLIELVVSIVVLGILLAIVLVNLSANKKEAIRVAVSSNTSILQNAVDQYYLKENKAAPTINNEEPTVRKPAIIDTDLLVKLNLIKQDVDLSKIKQQNYWLDSNGTVWGATENTISGLSLLSSDKKKELSFLISPELKSYNIYKVNPKNPSKSISSAIESRYTADSEKVPTKLDKQSVYEFENPFDEVTQITLPITDDAIYLVSGVDQYGLETAPVGSGSDTFKPLVNREGVFYYKVENLKQMTFIDFKALTDIPEGSSISYRFAVKENVDGDYGEWLSTFDEVLAIEKGHGATVEISMKGNDKGQFPSIYDLHLYYTYDSDTLTSFCYIFPEECAFDGNICEIIPRLCITDCIGSDCGLGGTSGTGGTGGGDGTGIGGTGGTGGGDGTGIGGTGGTGGGDGTGVGGTGGTGGGDGTGVGGTGGTGGGTGVGGTSGGQDICKIVPQLCTVSNCSADKNCPTDPIKVCASNQTKSHVSNNLTYVSLNFVLGSDERISKLHIPSPDKVNNMSNFKEVFIEYAVKGEPYKKATSVNEVPTGACVNIVYVYESLIGFPPPMPPICKVGIDCPPTCEELNECPILDCEETNSCIVEDKDPFVTLYGFRLFAHSSEGKTSTWTGYDKEDTVPEGTRIIYNFALNNGSGYGKETSTFPTNSESRSIMAHVQFQVRESLLDSGIEPTLESFKFNSNADTGTATQIPNRNKLDLYIDYSIDNNSNSGIISTDSKVKWSYFANLPKGLTIVEENWSIGNENINGVQYPAGRHSIQLSVKTSDGVWSQPVNYSFSVAEEKPTAKIELTQNNTLVSNKVIAEKPVVWKDPLTTSIDPDGDKLVAFEWRGSKQDSYDLGTYTVGLRVQDSDKNWSDWVDVTFKSDYNWVPIVGASNFKITYDFTEKIHLDTTTLKAITPENTRVHFTYYGSNSSVSSGLELLGDDIELLKAGHYRYYSIQVTLQQIEGKTISGNPLLVEKKVTYKNDLGVSKERIIYGNTAVLKTTITKTGASPTLYTVPASGYYEIELYGGQGGQGGSSTLANGNGTTAAAGGFGGYVFAKMFLEEGMILEVNNGASGATGTSVAGATGSRPKVGIGGGGGGGGGSVIQIQDIGVVMSARGGNGSAGSQRTTCNTSICTLVGPGAPGKGGASLAGYVGTNGVARNGGAGGGVSVVKEFDFIESSTIKATGVAGAGKTVITIIPN